MTEPDGSRPLTGSTTAAAGSSGISHGLTLLFAIAGGTAVANLYWAQPLLALIVGDLNASHTVAGWLVTGTQIGYAAGALLLVPLGDVLDRRRPEGHRSGRETRDRRPQQGAATQVWAATSPQLAGPGGLYLEDCDSPSRLRRTERCAV